MQTNAIMLKYKCFEFSISMKISHSYLATHSICRLLVPVQLHINGSALIMAQLPLSPIVGNNRLYIQHLTVAKRPSA